MARWRFLVFDWPDTRRLSCAGRLRSSLYVDHTVKEVAPMRRWNLVLDGVVVLERVLIWRVWLRVLKYKLTRYETR